MKRKKSVLRDEGKSLKTFFFYTAAVTVLILIALAIKVFFVIRASTFDGQHQFIIALVEQGRVREIASYDPSANTTAVLQIQNSTVQKTDIGKTLAVLPNATVTYPTPILLSSDSGQLISQLLTHYNSIQTNLTLYDLIRLFFFARTVPQINKRVQTLRLPADQNNVTMLIASLFTDQLLSQENVTIQVINATRVSGLGQRLERILDNEGANVVSVATAISVQQHSMMQYFGEPTYTLVKLQRLLQFPTQKMSRQGIADIIITIGEDQENTNKF